jgi:hypothetical protein
MRAFLALAALLAAAPALADDTLPQFPKAGPPQPLPEAACDTAQASDGAWLIGRWVAPRTRWEFTREDGAIAWSMERKGNLNAEFGWQDGTRIAGTAETVTACTVALVAGQGAFRFEGVLIDGKLFGYAANTKGEHVRFTLRRER